MMNILMQLRKICDHPDLLEPRPIVTSSYLSPLPEVTLPALVWDCLSLSPSLSVSLSTAGSTSSDSLSSYAQWDKVSDRFTAFAWVEDLSLDQRQSVRVLSQRLQLEETEREGEGEVSSWASLRERESTRRYKAVLSLSLQRGLTHAQNVLTDWRTREIARCLFEGQGQRETDRQRDRQREREIEIVGERESESDQTRVTIQTNARTLRAHTKLSRFTS
jgi:hypothetical protein